MQNQDITIIAKVAELDHKLSTTLERVAKGEATVEQLNKSVAAGTRMTIWQFISFVLVMSGTLFGTLYWAAGMLERRIEQAEKRSDERLEQMEKRFDERFEQMEKRFEQMEKRFEDLRQVVLSQQGQKKK